ncbi:hypothetical protein EII34_15550 [Arachnia propionica]|uniref:Uncharacterized protein n=1 Tax=Arachnia propionica TaxID=1750 RepID=A0A3P1T037_9ACTN|nr:hypothetical protein [Arachnia propionica]RRD02872.1 hypothetical protein EII34_15550 [Arachnia propionica]
MNAYDREHTKPPLSGPKITRKMRRFMEEMSTHGTPFQQLPWREGVDLWQRYVARTNRGQILLEFNGREWILSFAPPGAKYFARQEDWFTCIHGPTLGGYLLTGTSSIRWIKELIDSPSPPEINISELDRIVEKRHASQKKFGSRFNLFLLGGVAAIALFITIAIITNHAVAFGAAGVVFAALASALAALWRVNLRTRKLHRIKNKKRKQTNMEKN